MHGCEITQHCILLLILKVRKAKHQDIIRFYFALTYIHEIDMVVSMGNLFVSMHGCKHMCMVVRSPNTAFYCKVRKAKHQDIIRFYFALTT